VTPLVLVVYHSGYGHTAAQARAVCEGVLEVDGVQSRMVFSDEAAESPAVLDPATALIFGCPTYMGSASAQFKQFMDATAPIWRQQGWKDRLAAGFTSSGGFSGDKLNTLVQLMLFAMQHGMVWVGLGLPDGNARSDTTDANLNRLGAYAGAMAQADVDRGLDGMLDSDLATARNLGRRVGEATRRWNAAPLARVSQDGNGARPGAGERAVSS
jgi:NAD(P)H dehydrogenase (quinone)